MPAFEVLTDDEILIHAQGVAAVSYTHLDVYKRQIQHNTTVNIIQLIYSQLPIVRDQVNGLRINREKYDLKKL